MNFSIDLMSRDIFNVENKILGMVSVCAGCDAFKPWAGLVSGVIGGCLYVGFSKVCDPSTKFLKT